MGLGIPQTSGRTKGERETGRPKRDKQAEDRRHGGRGCPNYFLEGEDSTPGTEKGVTKWKLNGKGRRQGDVGIRKGSGIDLFPGY